MSTQVAIHHRTAYHYDRAIRLGSQIIRLRPAAHCRTHVQSYSLNVAPEKHFVNWQQDPVGNFQARVVFPDPVDRFIIDVDILADLTVINPFDFFLEEAHEQFPFSYDESAQAELGPYLETTEHGPLVEQFLTAVDLTPQHTIAFLVELNQRLHNTIEYEVRYDPGVQTCTETLQRRRGSCRDSAFLLVHILRRLGLAARFVSGYLVQLQSDESSTDASENSEDDSVDLHAWSEVYLPGAGWVGLDPTSGLLAGEGHIPLACTPNPCGAAPVSGSHEPCDVTFDVALQVSRKSDSGTPSKPYAEADWNRIIALGKSVDEILAESDVRLTMGGEPTFVSTSDRVSAQWRTEATGDEKSRVASQLAWQLKRRFAPGGILHFGQGKHYPGEELPRWAIRCYWRPDGERIWQDDRWLARASGEQPTGAQQARTFIETLTKCLNVDPDHIVDAYEAANTERPVGYVLPLQMRWWESPTWQSDDWGTSVSLSPGDSPIGFRLPLEAIGRDREAQPKGVTDFFPSDPLEPPVALPSYQQLQNQLGSRSNCSAVSSNVADSPQPRGASDRGTEFIHTALCVEIRDGLLHVFMPPVDRLEFYLELIIAVEQTAARIGIPVVVEGYPAPEDKRLCSFAITPDPGVIEVNVHPASDFVELVEITSAVYEEAGQVGLGAERFETDGTHTSTGGGNHIVLGGATPEDSPFLRRPDLVKSLIAYWHNHPALSYFFSGRFVGPTSQAPRIDEGNLDSLHELEIALEQISTGEVHPPWYVDRVLRQFLADRTGNRHRSEFCIDKLFAPECTNGRLGLLELRAFEMPPHAQMCLIQQLLVRALVARFWREPYELRLVEWGSTLHDRFMLPHFLWQDLCDVLEETSQTQMQFEPHWFTPQLEFRFPKVGTICEQGVELEIRQAIEPWYVMGDEDGGTARYVDSSIERFQVLVRGMTDTRHCLACNGRKVPLHPTGVEGEFVAGIRFRAWQPPSCTHPTIPVDAPITFDLVDNWMNRSLGGCRYHVGHPGGLNPTTFPVNSNEAESRRAARFTQLAHTSGPIHFQRDEPNALFPLTLDLRRHCQLSHRRRAVLATT